MLRNRRRMLAPDGGAGWPEQEGGDSLLSIPISHRSPKLAGPNRYQPNGRSVG